MIEEAQTVRDAILNSQPSESSRERAQREFEESVNNIRSLAQEQFNSQLRLEMNERKWALDLVDSNVVRQQQWILDNIHKHNERTPITPHDAPKNSEGGFSVIPRQQGDSERGSHENFEERYGSGGIDDEGDEPDESTGEEEEEEEGEWGDSRQSRPPLRSKFSLIQGLRSRSPISRNTFLSRQRQPSNFQSGEDNDDEDAEDPQSHPVLWHGGQPFPPGAARRQRSSSQASVWRSTSRAPEPSGPSRPSAHANGQAYNSGPVRFPRRGSVNSTGSTSGGAGLHRAGPLNDQHPSGSVASHSDTERPRTQNPSRQRQPSSFQPGEDNDDKDAEDPQGHMPRHGGQPFPSEAARLQRSSSQPSVWHPASRAQEPSGLSRTFAHANGQMYSPGQGPVQFPRRGSVNSTGSTSSGTGLHRAGSLNDQHRSGSVAPHSGTECPPAQNRDRIASTIGPRERQTSASASPHDRPSPPSYPIVSPRAIPVARPPPLDDAVRFPTSGSPSSRVIYSMQRSPEDMKQGIAIPRGPTTPEDGPRGMSWGSGSLNSRRSFGDFNVHRRHNSKGDSRLPPVDGDLSDASDDVLGQLDDRQSMHSIRSLRSVRSVRSMELEQRAVWLEAEARRKEEEASRKEEEASRKEEEAHRLEEKARLSLEEAERLELEARQTDASAKTREAIAQQKEAEAMRKEAEAKKREAQVQKREADAQRKEEQARHRDLEVRRKEEQARRKEEEAQRKEEGARRREEEVRRKEDDARKREDDARKREEDARQREMLARQKEEDVRRFEEEARKREEETKRKEDEAKRKEEEAGRRREEAKRKEEDYERKKREIDRKEAELKKRETELLLKEAAARKAEEEAEAARQAEGSSRLEAEEVVREAEVPAPLEAEESTVEVEEAARDSTRQAQDAESAAAEQAKQIKAQGRKASKATKRQKEEQRRQKELEQQQRLEEQQQQRHLEEQRRVEEQRREEERLKRERDEQIRLDEELSRQEQARLDREALLELERLQREAQEIETNRLLEEQRRAAEEERHRILDEQRRKATEQSRHRDELRHQQQHQQEEDPRQRAREEQQKEFAQREARYYQRTLERERQNSMGASFDSGTPHRPGSTTGSAGDRSSASSTSTFSSSASSTWSSRPTSINSSHTANSSFSSSSVPLSTTPRPSPTSARPGAPGTSPYATKFDEAEWARRAEERARQQQEQFKREQERLESERHAKTTKVLSRDELVRLYENHENKWRQLRDSDTSDLGWNSFAWPVFKRPSEPEDMTTSAISAYVFSKYAPDINGKSHKDRIKDHLKRWHPDKFETRILPRVVEEEREKVKAGAGIVVRGLNEMKNYED